MEHTEDALLHRTTCAKIEDLDLRGLAKPMQPADPLLDHHRVPWQVEVHQPMAMLQVVTLASNIRGHEDLHLSHTKRSESRLLVCAGQLAMDRGVGDALADEPLDEPARGRPVSSEHEHLRGAACANDVDERAALASLLDACGTPDRVEPWLAAQLVEGAAYRRWARPGLEQQQSRGATRARVGGAAHGLQRRCIECALA